MGTPRESIKYPYPKCETCTTLGDCPEPFVDSDGLGTPLCPDCCPRPIDIMRETLKRKKRYGRSDSR